MRSLRGRAHRCSGDRGGELDAFALASLDVPWK
jgi:hypothetical protein